MIRNPCTHLAGVLRRALVPPALALAIALQGCAVNPATGKRQFSLIGEGQEIAMGREYDQEIVASLGLYPDTALQRYVQELGMRLAAQSERPNLPWTFRVVDDPVVNAFALPGGYIYITRGILAHLNSEAELAAVIGHEIGHVTARHSVTRMSTQQLAQLGLAVGVALRPELGGYAQAASAGLQLLFLKHGREDESQSDELGLRYMMRAGYDPREMAGVFEMLSRVSQAAGGGRVPEWLSTHPDPENRRDRISRQVAAMTQDFSGSKVERASYLRRLNGLVFGDDPREGYFRGNEFLHPTLAFRLTFPEGWQTSNQKQAVLAVSPEGDAVVQVTLAGGSSPEAAARSFFAQDGVAGSVATGEINGLRAAGGEFAATSQGQVVRGRVAFVAHGDAVYQLLAYAVEARWGARAEAAGRAIGSFSRLTDKAALAVEPFRLEIVTLDRALSLDEFVRRYPSGVPLETVALINQVDAGARFESGAVVKRVVGKPVS
jgi:predicted Zn-dependent protease